MPCLTPNTINFDVEPQTGKVAVVTGANTGLGLATATELARCGARVVFACRSEERGLSGIRTLRKAVPDADVEFLPLDLADQGSIRAFAAALRVKHSHIDLLVNNAGVMFCSNQRTKEGLELQMGTNHHGHYLLTLLLVPLLRRAPSGKARVATMSSMIAFFPLMRLSLSGRIYWGDVNWERSYNRFAAYEQSKTANLVFTEGLRARVAASRKEGDAEILCLSAHPGATATELFRHAPASDKIESVASMALMTPEQGALSMLYACLSPNVQDGGFYGPRYVGLGPPAKVGLPWIATDEESVNRLWALSEKATGETL